MKALHVSLTKSVQDYYDFCDVSELVSFYFCEFNDLFHFFIFLKYFVNGSWTFHDNLVIFSQTVWDFLSSMSLPVILVLAKVQLKLENLLIYVYGGPKECSRSDYKSVNDSNPYAKLPRARSWLHLGLSGGHWHLLDKWPIKISVIYMMAKTTNSCTKRCNPT